MITRIVKMTFKPEQVESFLDIFENSARHIASFEGCLSLELVQGKDNKNIFFTISKWNSEEDLQKYRNSGLFKETWAKTKVLFDDKPQAWSTVTRYKVK